jgi:hypothetical protein
MAVVSLLIILVLLIVAMSIAEHEGLSSSPSALNSLIIEKDDKTTQLLSRVYDHLDERPIGASGKLFPKKLKSLRKELVLVKRIHNQRMKERRTEYTRTRRFADPKEAGGGAIGAFIRGRQTRNHHIQRVALAEDLLPLELERDRIEQAIIEIDSTLLRLQGGSVLRREG